MLTFTNFEHFTSLLSEHYHFLNTTDKVKDEVTGGILDLAYNEELSALASSNGASDGLGQYSDRDGGGVFGATSAMFLINGKYVNANEAGNYAIAVAWGIAGGSSSGLKFRANGYSFLSGDGLDEPHEQRMLDQGAAKAAEVKNQLIQRRNP